MRLNKLILIVCLELFGLSCARRQNANSENNPTKEKNSTRVPAVGVTLPQTRVVSASVPTTGSFVAIEASDVSPSAVGRVQQTPVNVGDFVKVGQVIAKLEDVDAKLKLDQADAAERQSRSAYDSTVAQARMARAEAERFASLFQTGIVSKSAYEKARTEADAAEAQLDSANQQSASMKAQSALARKANADTLIRAPFAGFVSARPTAVGEYVALSSIVATILRITPIRLELQVSQAEVSQVKLGSTVQTIVNGYPGRVFEGKVSAVNPAVDATSRTFVVIAEFPNVDLALKPGMFATARILLPGNSQGLFVRRESVLTDETTNSSQVFFVRDGKARVAVVQLGATDGNSIQVLSGISADMKIVSNNLKDLYDGQSVQISDSKP